LPAGILSQKLQGCNSGKDVYALSYRADTANGNENTHWADDSCDLRSGKIRRENCLAEETFVKKVFYFDAPREKYQCDAAILWCFDNRFDLGFRKFLKRIGVINFDPIKVAGGAKSLASPERETDREFLLEQIRKSIRLHGTKRLILMVHSDCGAYGGLATGFRGDAQAEAVHHEIELQGAAAKLLEAFPGLEVQGYFVDFEGVWEVEIDAAREIQKHAVA